MVHIVNVHKVVMIDGKAADFASEVHPTPLFSGGKG